MLCTPPESKEAHFPGLVLSVLHKQLRSCLAIGRWHCSTGCGTLATRKTQKQPHKHTAVCLMRSLRLERVQKASAFYQNSALCMFSALIYIFCVSPTPGLAARAEPGDSVPQPSDTRNVRRMSSKPPSFQPKAKCHLKEKIQ